MTNNMRQGTRATKHDGSAVLLRKILNELKEINNKLNNSLDDKGEIKRMDTLIKLGKNKRKYRLLRKYDKITHNLSIEEDKK
jgi:hypothetical protein|tara:strand:+ start:786 stop:1031 length:246 start_codon:yes stop_codon:yes gene_type:complete